MGRGVLEAVLEQECRTILPSPSGLQLSYATALFVLLLTFFAGCCCGAVLLGSVSLGAWRWWRRLTLQACSGAGECGGVDRLEGYRRG